MVRSWLLILPVLSGVGLWGGCSGAKPAAQAEPQGLAEREPQPPLSAQEVGRQYGEAYADGVRLVGQKQYGLAMGAFEQAIKLRPDSTEALFNLAACYEAVGDPAQAIVMYRRVLQVTPDDPDCYANLGTSFIKLYHRDKSPVWRKMARDAWRRSLDLKPDQPDVQGYLARTQSTD